MNIKKYLSGSLKIVLAGIVAISANTALANSDLTKSENYFPGAKYDLFNGGRFARQGSKIVDVNNHIRVNTSSVQAGAMLIELQQYGGGIEFERSFENHPLSEHGSWSRSNKRQLPFFHGSVSGGLSMGVSKGTIYGVEIHPEDAYDAADGGNHPYDIYNYRISGQSITTSIDPLDLPRLLPTPLVSPYNGNGDNGSIGQAESGADTDSRDDNIRNEYTNGQPEKSDDGSWDNAEVKSPIDVNKAELAIDGAGWTTDFLTSLGKKYNPNKLSIVRLEEQALTDPRAKKLMDDIGRFGDDVADKYKKPISSSGKDRATDIPSWAKGKKPYTWENGKTYAQRLMDEKYGKGNWKTSSKEYSELKKHGDRGYE